MFANLRIGSRLTLGFGVVLALLCLMAGISAWQSSKLAGNSEYYAVNLVPSFKAVHDITMDLDGIRRWEFRHLVNDDMKSKDESEAKMLEFQKSIQTKLDQYSRELVSNDEDRRAMEDLRGVEHTVAFYEAPHRIAEALTDIAAVLPSRQIVVARELTKLHEEFLRGTAEMILAELLARPAIKGEITLLIGPGSREIDATKSPEEAVRELESQGMAHMDAVKQVAHERGIPKRELYRRTLETGNS